VRKLNKTVCVPCRQLNRSDAPLIEQKKLDSGECHPHPPWMFVLSDVEAALRSAPSPSSGGLSAAIDGRCGVVRNSGEHVASGASGSALPLPLQPLNAVQRLLGPDWPTPNLPAVSLPLCCKSCIVQIENKVLVSLALYVVAGVDGK
jgi:hypothetical protein